MSDVESIAREQVTRAYDPAPGRALVVYMTNVLAPYRLPVLTALSQSLGSFKILLSAAIDRHRDWPAAWGTLDVETQRSLSWKARVNRTTDLELETTLHLPYDTVPRLIRHRPRVVMTSEMGARTIQAYLYRRLFRGSRMMICADLSEHTERQCGWLRRTIRRHLLRHADAVLVNGESGRRYVEAFGARPERVGSVPFATDRQPPAALPDRGGDEQPLRLLYVGSLIERKGLVPFLQALVAWALAHPAREIEFTLVGGGELQPVLQAQPLPANLRLRFVGHMPYASLPSVYAQADVFAFPSLGDTWGVVVNEAMQWGLPVLGSIRSQAVDELVDEGVHGWRFDTIDAAGMAAAIDRALSTSAERRQAIGREARARASAITPETVAEQTAAIVRRLLDTTTAGHRAESLHPMRS